jgi:hypothetical protein
MSRATSRLLGSDFEGIGLKEQEVELWISYFTTTHNRRGIRCAPLDWGTRDAPTLNGAVDGKQGGQRRVSRSCGLLASLR